MTNFSDTQMKIYRHFTSQSHNFCCSCKREFRRELCFRHMTGPYYGGSGVWRYVCGNCADSIEDAEAIFRTSPWMTPSIPPEDE